MPARYEMTWESTPRRWRKMVNGRYLTVSVKQLRKHFADPTIPETKEGSYQWANRFWHEKRSETSNHPTRSGYDRDGDYWHEIRKEGKWLLASQDDDSILAIPDGLASEIINFPLAQSRHDPAQPPVDRTIGALVERYLETVMGRHRAGEIGVNEYANTKLSLFYFRDRLGSTNAIEIINADRWDGYYRHLIGDTAPKSIRSRKKHFYYAKHFLQWASDLNIHPVPPNLNRKQYRFKGIKQAVPTIGIDTVKATIHAARGQLKLHLLLMLNCGFTQQDISDLHPSEVDWEHGRIRRKRSKTGDHDNVPMVDYVLWNETFDLLKQYRSNDPDHVLLTESGKAWMRDDIHDDGSRSRTDAIQSNYRRLNVEHKQPLKMFRKAGATMLNESSEHGRFAQHYLGQANTIATMHYIHQNGASFDEAIRWLGSQYGF